MKEILITATVLILCVLLIRRVFRGKISSGLLYALWLLVALRLLLPVSAEFNLGSLSRFRLMDLVEEDESGIGERLEETIRLEEPIQMTVDSRSILFRLFVADEVKETLEDMPEDGPTSVFLAGTIGFSLLNVLWFLWGIGAFVVGMWILVTNLVFCHRLRKTRRLFNLPEGVKAVIFGDEEVSDGEGKAAGQQKEESAVGEQKDRHFFRKGYRLPAFYLAEGISSPCLYGLPGHEAVYLTADVAKDPDRLRHVVVHELVHKKHGDSFWALLRSVLVTVYWFHPLVWVAAVCSRRDCELACDEGALAELGEEERIPYGETLLSIITRKANVSDLVCTATTMTGSGKRVKERIRFIAERPRTLFAAAAGVLVLTAVVCLFVFTKDAGFQGTIVDSRSGLTVTGADMQIPLPASIGGISGCVVEKESDEVVIYHVAAQEEVGRFARMSMADALKLADEGREITPVGDYGDNYLLRAYLGEPMTRTEHTYTFPLPAEDENPLLSKDWEVIPLEEEELSEGKEEKRGGTLGHEDIYMPAGDEEEVDYLPNEQITTVTYQPHEVNKDEIRAGCYVYVKADYYGKVKDKYREAMDYINEQLQALTDQVVILSLNRDRREALYDALTANRTPYVGDNSKVGALIDALPLPPTLNRSGDFSLQTSENPYSLRFGYEMSMDHFTKEDHDMMYFNAAMLFYAIGNVEEIDMEIRDPAKSASTMMFYHREELEKDLPMLQNADYEDDQVFRDRLIEVQAAAEKHLSTALRAYLTAPSAE